ncbi:MAG TPA: tRNA uridine-5-carboxymethylaminomethyl(34) synthesis GTPase MnmE [Thermomicrobiales bacterium]|nr:tRNA uridine-5-carboxymethylaminomethyl(34) synthesis GTPase MnmE [Thermomicrobiales bacterium]
MYQDTIAAIATPQGEGGIGIVRLSGPDAGGIAATIFRRGRLGTRITADELISHRLTYGTIVDPTSGRVVDEVMIVRMVPPRTYTREEIVEINCHGGFLPVRRVLDLCLTHGARMATAGEFTLRAFLNGRIDLSQAEAVAGVISARTPRSLDLAVAELRGQLTERLRPARDTLVETLAYVDAAADFPDDEIPPLELSPALDRAADELASVIAAASAGVLYREGVRIAIVGRPNAGKSSLLNRLLGSDRAIVTDIAGTTRDVIAETVNLLGIPATLLDTAGIAESEDAIERIGIARSRQALASSGIALFVIDRSRPAHSDDREIANLLAEQLSDGGVVVALNKRDLPVTDSQAATLTLLPGAPVVEVSTHTGEGISDLLGALHATVTHQAGQAGEPALATVRQLDALRRALAHVEAARAARATGYPVDILSIDLRAALHAVGEVTGEAVDEAVLDEIFSRFCIGK